MSSCRHCLAPFRADPSVLTPLLFTPSLIRTQLLRNRTLVSFGDVEEAHAALEDLADEPHSGGPVQPGAVAEAQPHAAEAERRDWS